MIEKWTQEEIDVIQETILHWERMKSWAEEQDPKDKADSYKMDAALGEIWGSSHCALCQLDKKRNPKHRDYNCDPCPLERAGLGCLKPNSPYKFVAHSKTWRKFAAFAPSMIAALNSLLAEEKTQ